MWTAATESHVIIRSTADVKTLGVDKRRLIKVSRPVRY